MAILAKFQICMLKNLHCRKNEYWAWFCQDTDIAHKYRRIKWLNKSEKANSLTPIRWSKSFNFEGKLMYYVAQFSQENNYIVLLFLLVTSVSNMCIEMCKDLRLYMFAFHFTNHSWLFIAQTFITWVITNIWFKCIMKFQKFITLECVVCFCF